eukprot:8289633-Pyramimonas_sp.AAC.1
MTSDWEPEYDMFEKALKEAKKCADGWSYRELRALARLFPTITRELVELWLDTSRRAVLLRGRLPQHILDLVFGWRIAGIPKGESDTRPIAVAS